MKRMWSQISKLVCLRPHWTSQRFVSLVSRSDLMGWVCRAVVFNFAFVRPCVNYQSHGPQPCAWSPLSNETEMRQTAGIYGSLDAHAMRKLWYAQDRKTNNRIYKWHIVINYAQIDVNVKWLSVCKLKNAQSKIFVWKKPKQINTQLHEDTQECLQSKTHPRAWQTHPQPTSNRSSLLISAPSLTHSFYQPQGISTINDHADDRLSGCVWRGLGCGQMVCVRVCECESLREAAHGSGDWEACLGGLWVKTRRSAFRPVLQHKGSCVGLHYQQL